MRLRDHSRSRNSLALPRRRWFTISGSGPCCGAEFEVGLVAGSVHSRNSRASNLSFFGGAETRFFFTFFQGSFPFASPVLVTPASLSFLQHLIVPPLRINLADLFFLAFALFRNDSFPIDSRPPPPPPTTAYFFRPVLHSCSSIPPTQLTFPETPLLVRLLYFRPS